MQVAGIADTDRAAVILPAGRTGPALLVFRNYDAIYSYNAAESYALAIATLADQLQGLPGFSTPWPTDDRGWTAPSGARCNSCCLRAAMPLARPTA